MGAQERDGKSDEVGVMADNKTLLQGFAAQSPESADKFQADLLDGFVIQTKEKARDEIMERVARTLSAHGIQFRLTKKYDLELIGPIQNESGILAAKAVEIVSKHGAEEAMFEN